MTTIEILKESRRKIDEEGWIQKAFIYTDCKGNKSYCLRGAIS